MKSTLHILLTLTLAFAATSMQAQQDGFQKKKLIKDLKVYQKAENFAKMDEEIRKAMNKYPAAKNDAEVANYELNAQFGLMQQESRKIYLNSKPDTAKYFARILDVYAYGLMTDSLDRLPNQKGEVKQQYSSNISTKLSSTRGNLRSGGKYFYKNRKYDEAYKYFDMYLTTIGNQLIMPTERPVTPPIDADSVEISRLAVLSAYSAQNYPGVVRHLTLALTDTTNHQRLMEAGAKSYELTGDTTRYMETLLQAFDLYPQNEYFYATLINIYSKDNDYKSSLGVVNRLIEVDAQNRKYWYLKGKMHQTQRQLDEAITAYQHAVEINPDDVESYASLGNIYIEQANAFYKTANLKLGAQDYEKNRKQLNEYYQNARHALENCRRIAPDDKSYWQSGLREVYFKLNMGKELKSVE